MILVYQKAVVNACVDYKKHILVAVSLTAKKRIATLIYKMTTVAYFKKEVKQVAEEMTLKVSGMT